MSHEIFNNRFMSLRQPAWHRLGKVFKNPLTAREAWTEMGPYKVVKAPIYAQNQVGEGIVPVKNKFAVTGIFDNKGLNEQHHYGLVDARYELISPDQLISLWEMATGATIETMGVLQHGKRFFMTTELPSFGVKGDEHKMFMSLISPHGSRQSLILLLSPVRVVCWNTAQAAIEAAKVEYRVPHIKGATNKVGRWLKEQFEGAAMKSEVMKEALTILTTKTVSAPEVKSYLDELVPVPVETAAVDNSDARIKAQGTQDTITALFGGEAIGAETEAFDGTLYGLYNSVVEYVDYHTKGTTATAGWGFGSGAKLKEKAFDLAQELVKA
jgi:phage/plasmid-like protein (TIGR03299 family)